MVRSLECMINSCPDSRFSIRVVDLCRSPTVNLDLPTASLINALLAQPVSPDREPGLGRFSVVTDDTLNSAPSNL